MSPPVLHRAIPPFMGYSTVWPYARQIMMNRTRVFLAAILIGAGISSPVLPVHADEQDEQDAAREATMRGQVLPLRIIERRILPQLPGAAYIGPEYDPERSVYRLKFMRGAKVIWVDVDGHTGQVIGRSR